MARLLIGMWLLLIMSLSAMFLLMGDFLAERKHAEVSSPIVRPHARVPRNSADQPGLGLPTIEAKDAAVLRTEPAGDEKPASRQLRDDNLEAPPSLALSPNTERSKPLRSVNASAPPSDVARPPAYTKKLKRRGGLERRRLGARLGNRRLFR
jgi:hypothetical protein